MALDQHGVLLKMVVIVSQHHLTGRLCWSWLSWFICLSTRLWDAAPLVVAHRALGLPLYCMGEVAQAREHFAQSVALYDPQRHRTLAFAYGQDPGVAALVFDALTLWTLGYPDQAL